MNENFDFGAIDNILAEVGCAPSAIIAVLQSIQEHFHYIPREVFPYLSEKLGVGEAKIYSVATFYENFSLEPKGKFVIKVCDGTACHVRKSIPILTQLPSSFSPRTNLRQTTLASQSRQYPASALAVSRPHSR